EESVLFVSVDHWRFQFKLFFYIRPVRSLISSLTLFTMVKSLIQNRTRSLMKSYLMFFGRRNLTLLKIWLNLIVMEAV
ncbi:MAG: hypothetical protein VX677_08825, partial [Candidatus Poribacteria bacterium]|nr:hypothetical protein [Candidatus Poribacteria bacterium]